MSAPKAPRTPIKELRSLVKLMRSEGVLKLKVNGIELEMTHAALDKVDMPKKEAKLTPAEEFGGADPKVIVEPWKQYTDEQLATWSSAGIGEGEEEQSEQETQ